MSNATKSLLKRVLGHRITMFYLTIITALLRKLSIASLIKVGLSMKRAVEKTKICLWLRYCL